MKIFDLLNYKEKKELLTYLKNNGVMFTSTKNRKEYDYIIFPIGEGNLQFQAEAWVDKKDIVCYRLILENEDYNNQELAHLTLNLKEQVSDELGNPKEDNTNHLLENRISITYEKENWKILLSCRDYDNTEGRCFVVLTFVNMLKMNAEPQLKKPNSWLLYMLGGFLFGLLMFLTSEKYSWLNFGIWILGGALWGVLFGLLMNLFMGKDNDALNMKGQRKVLNKGLNQIEHGDLFEGTIYYETSNKWTGKYIQAAAMEVKDKEAILYFMKKKNVVDIHASLESICKDLYFYQKTPTGYVFNFKVEERNYAFFMSEKEKIDELIHVMDHQLFANQEYMPLFLELKKVTKEYNPYQLYELSDETCLDQALETIAKLLTIGKMVTQEYLKKIMLQVFDEDDYYVLQLSSLYWKIYSKTKDEHR